VECGFQLLQGPQEFHDHIMPTIFRKNGYRFFFYSNDHEPIHVHVEMGGGEAKFHVTPVIELVESAGFKTRQLSEIESIIEENTSLIVSSWKRFFDKS
jgi:hypothetical protein